MGDTFLTDMSVVQTLHSSGPGPSGRQSPTAASLITEQNARIVGDQRPAPMAAYALLKALSQAVEDRTVLVAGDSTSSLGDGGGGDAQRWPAQWAALMAAAWPKYTVLIQQWQTAGGTPAHDWPAPTVVQHGPAGIAVHAGASGSAASTTITDASIATADVGKRVWGYNIPPGSYVGAVVNGVSFTLANSNIASPGTTLPWGTVAGVTIGADPVLRIFDASVAGSRWLNGFGPYADAQYARTHPHLIIANHGHNEAIVASATARANALEIFRQDYLCGIEMLTALCPDAPVLVTAQNPRTDSQAADAPIRARIVSDIASIRGYEVIDVYQAFIDYGDWQHDLMQFPPGTGAVHPNTAGSAVWAAEVQRHFTAPADRRSATRAPAPSLFRVPPPEQLALGLPEFIASGHLPSTWSVVKASIAVDAINGVPCAKVISTGNVGYVEIPLDLATVAGQWVTATAWCYSASASSSISTGCIGIRWMDANGQPHTEQSEQNGSAARDAWYFQSIAKRIPADALSCAVWIYGDVSGATSNPTWYRNVQATRSRLPSGPAPSPNAAAFVPGSVTNEMVASAANIAPAKIDVLKDYVGYIGPLFPGVVGAYFTTPDAPANRITGDIDLRVKLPAGTNTRQLGALIAKYGSNSAYSWLLELRANGTLGFFWHSTGNALISVLGNGLLDATLTVDTYVRVVLDVNNGAGQYTVTFSTSTDGTTWTTLGTVTTGATGVTDIVDCAENVEVGSYLRGTDRLFQGTILQADVRSTIGGSAVATFTWPDPTAATHVATTGETWSVRGAMTWAYGLTSSVLTETDRATLAASGDVAAVAADLAELETDLGEEVTRAQDAEAVLTSGVAACELLANKSTSTSLGTSDTLYPSQKAVKSYVDSAVTGLWDDKGPIDCSTNPNYPAASKGDAYAVSVAGKIGGASGISVDVGDLVVAHADNAGGSQASVGASWQVYEHNLVGAILEGDSRLTNPRTPTAHASTHVGGGTDAIATAVASGAAGLLSGTDKAKLDNLTSLATALAGATVPKWSLDRLRAGVVPRTSVLNTSMDGSTTTMVTTFGSANSKGYLSQLGVATVVRIDDEEMLISASTAGQPPGTPGGTFTFTVTRGVNGTTAAAHTAGAKIRTDAVMNVCICGDSITYTIADDIRRDLDRRFGGLGLGFRGIWRGNEVGFATGIEWTFTGTAPTVATGVNDIGPWVVYSFVSGSGNYATWTAPPEAEIGQLDVYWVDVPGGTGNWSYSTDGGTTWVNNPNYPGSRPAAPTLMKSKIVVENPATLLLRAANAAGTGAAQLFSGVDVWSTRHEFGVTTGVKFHEFGYTGNTLANFAVSDTGGDFGRIFDGDAASLVPMLVIVGPFSNDSVFSSATAAYATNLATIVSRVSTYADVLFLAVYDQDRETQSAVVRATTAALPSCTYANGTAGVGATLTATANGALSIDGGAPTVGQRVLVKNQASSFQNGVYTVTATGSAGAAFVLTRATDFDTAAEVLAGLRFNVTTGTTNGGTLQYVTSADSPTIGSGAITFSTTPTGSTYQANAIANRAAMTAAGASGGHAVLNLYDAFAAEGFVGWDACNTLNGSVSQPNGLMIDGAHPSTLGQRDIVARLSRVLTTF